MGIANETVRALARDCGFELAGVARALPAVHAGRYRDWVTAGFAGEMRYLTDYRAEVREDPRRLLGAAKSIICVGKLYHTGNSELDWISRYAWGSDYHTEMRRGLQRLEELLQQECGPFESKICVDTAPLLERSYAREAGLGWIGKNTCLINQQTGSWYFLGELLVSLEIEPDVPPPDRCGSCTRCIDACPTSAIVPSGVDSRLCISYFTIELRGAVPEEHRAGIGHHVFGCDICQDVCPWNRRAPLTEDPAYQARPYAPELDALAALSEAEFKALFRDTPVSRARYSGFLRNVAIAMGNARLEKFRAPLEKLAGSADPLVAEHARWGLDQLP
jgi:epoxyqueuosine reductase